MRLNEYLTNAIEFQDFLKDMNKKKALKIGKWKGVYQEKFKNIKWKQTGFSFKDRPVYFSFLAKQGIVVSKESKAEGYKTLKILPFNLEGDFKTDVKNFIQQIKGILK